MDDDTPKYRIVGEQGPELLHITCSEPMSKHAVAEEIERTLRDLKRKRDER